jgi:hypothetical protein
MLPIFENWVLSRFQWSKIGVKWTTSKILACQYFTQFLYLVLFPDLIGWEIIEEYMKLFERLATQPKLFPS